MVAGKKGCWGRGPQANRVVGGVVRRQTGFSGAWSTGKQDFQGRGLQVSRVVGGVVCRLTDFSGAWSAGKQGCWGAWSAGNRVGGVGGVFIVSKCNMPLSLLIKISLKKHLCSSKFVMQLAEGFSGVLFLQNVT